MKNSQKNLDDVEKEQEKLLLELMKMKIEVKDDGVTRITFNDDREFEEKHFYIFDVKLDSDEKDFEGKDFHIFSNFFLISKSSFFSLFFHSIRKHSSQHCR